MINLKEKLYLYSIYIKAISEVSFIPKRIHGFHFCLKFSLRNITLPLVSPTSCVLKLGLVD